MFKNEIFKLLHTVKYTFIFSTYYGAKIKLADQKLNICSDTEDQGRQKF